MKTEFEQILEKVPYIQIYATQVRDEMDDEGRLTYSISVQTNSNNSVDDAIAMLGRLCMIDPATYYKAMYLVVQEAENVIKVYKPKDSPNENS